MTAALGNLYGCIGLLIWLHRVTDITASGYGYYCIGVQTEGPFQKDFENLGDFKQKDFENLGDFRQKDFEEKNILCIFAPK